MSLAKRMAAIVGDENTVGRYLLEKVGHTALIAWVLVMMAGVSPLWAAFIAAVGYDLVGKVLWLSRATNRAQTSFWFEARDTVFDLWVGLLVLVIATCSVSLAYGLGAFGLWSLGFLVLDNNAWGSPS